jgi:hypothetical protein
MSVVDSVHIQWNRGLMYKTGSVEGISVEALSICGNYFEGFAFTPFQIVPNVRLLVNIT